MARPRLVRPAAPEKRRPTPRPAAQASPETGSPTSLCVRGATSTSPTAVVATPLSMATPAGPSSTVAVLIATACRCPGLGALFGDVGRAPYPAICACVRLDAFNGVQTGPGGAGTGDHDAARPGQLVAAGVVGPGT